MAELYYQPPSYTESLELLEICERNYDEIRDTLGLSMVNDFKGVIFREFENYDSSELELKRAIDFSNYLGDTIGLAYAYCHISEVYLDKDSVKLALKTLGKIEDILILPLK